MLNILIGFLFRESDHASNPSRRKEQFNNNNIECMTIVTPLLYKDTYFWIRILIENIYHMMG